MKDTHNLTRLKDGRWKVSVYLPHGLRLKRIRRAMPNYEYAKNFRDRIHAAIADGTIRALVDTLLYGSEQAHTIRTFTPVFLEYCESRKKRPASVRRYELSLRHICDICGDIPLAQFSRADVESFIDRRTVQLSERDGEVISAASVNRDIAALSSMFTCALHKGLIPHHPMVRVRRLAVDETEKWIPSAEQVKTLVQALERHDLALAALAVFISETGCRRGEALRLERSHIDYRTRKVMITSAAKGRRVRYIPLSDLAIEWLQRIPPRIGNERVFINQNSGDPWVTIEKAWGEALEEIGLPELSRHALRHYRCTQWLQNGLEPHIVQYLMGHADLATTMIYVHIVQKHLDSAVREAQAREMA